MQNIKIENKQNRILITQPSQNNESSSHLENVMPATQFDTLASTSKCSFSNMNSNANQMPLKKSKLAHILNTLKPSNLKMRFKVKSLSKNFNPSSNPMSPVRNFLSDTETKEFKKAKSNSFLYVDSSLEQSVASTTSMPDDFRSPIRRPSRKLKKNSLEKETTNRKKIKPSKKKNAHSSECISFSNKNTPLTNFQSNIQYFDEDDYMDAFRYFDIDGDGR